MIQPIRNESIWLPNSAQLNVRETAAARAVREYDAGLQLGQTRDNGEWVVFITDGPGGQPFPALGLGFELPAPEEIKRRLYNSDTKRHGSALAVASYRRNRARQRDIAAKGREASEEMARHFEWAHRKVGSRPEGRIFVPGEKA